MTALSTLARMLGIRHDQTEDALRSERAARATLNRRGLLLGGAAAAAHLATGSAWSFGTALPDLLEVGAPFGRAAGFVHFAFIKVWGLDEASTGFFINDSALSRGSLLDFPESRS